MLRAIAPVLLALATAVSGLADPVGAPKIDAADKELITASVTLPASRILPGVPFDIVVTVKNESKRSVAIGGPATLVVTFADGHTIIFHHADANDMCDLAPNEFTPIAPGDSLQRVATWDRGFVPNWFQYSAFSGPGSYEVAVDLPLVDGDSEKYIGSIRSSSARLERVVPSGEDTALWEKMQQLSDGNWSDDWFQRSPEGRSLAEEIVKIHPTSGYYPYALFLPKSFRDKSDISSLVDAAKRFPQSPASPYLLKAAADAALYEATTAELRKQDLSTASSYYDKADSLYRQALETKSPGLRPDAERRLHDVSLGRERLKNKREQ